MLLTILASIFQILLLTVFCYCILRVLRHTPGVYVFTVMTGCIFMLSIVGYWLHLEAVTRTMEFILKYVFPVAFVVIFQQDLRRWLLLLASLGNDKRTMMLWRRTKQKKLSGGENAVHELVNTACSLSARPEWRSYLLNASNPSPVPSSRLSPDHTGALIAISREHDLKEFREQGESLKCAVNCLLLRSIFHDGAPLHDGGVIITQKDGIVAAGCRFPLSLQGRLEPVHTRHNAALGLSEISDALVIVVSEETGTVSVAHGSAITRVESPVKLAKLLNQHYGIKSDDQEINILPGLLERIIIYIANGLGASV